MDAKPKLGNRVQALCLLNVTHFVFGLPGICFPYTGNATVTTHLKNVRYVCRYVILYIKET